MHPALVSMSTIQGRSELHPRYRCAWEAEEVKSEAKMKAVGNNQVQAQVMASVAKAAPDQTSGQLVGAFGERAVEAELLRRCWVTANINASIRNVKDFDLFAVKKKRPITAYSCEDVFSKGGCPIPYAQRSRDNNRRYRAYRFHSRRPYGFKARRRPLLRSSDQGCIRSLGRMAADRPR